MIMFLNHLIYSKVVTILTLISPTKYFLIFNGKLTTCYFDFAACAFGMTSATVISAKVRKHVVKYCKVKEIIITRSLITVYPVGIHLLKVNSRNTRTRFAICSKLTIKTPERRHWEETFPYLKS